MVEATLDGNASWRREYLNWHLNSEDTEMQRRRKVHPSPESNILKGCEMWTSLVQPWKSRRKRDHGGTGPSVQTLWAGCLNLSTSDVWGPLCLGEKGAVVCSVSCLVALVCPSDARRLFLVVTTRNYLYKWPNVLEGGRVQNRLQSKVTAAGQGKKPGCHSKCKGSYGNASGRQ